jgi:glycerophosphoryl diester phosphodiesterase
MLAQDGASWTNTGIPGLAARVPLGPGAGTLPGPGKLGNLWFLLRSLVRRPPRRSRYVALQVPTRFRWLRVVDERLVRAAHRSGLAVHVWTIEDERKMWALVALGVHGIMNDRPLVLASVLRPNHERRLTNGPPAPELP